MILAALALASAGVPGREALGAFGGWAAFRDRSPGRCFAIATPSRTGARPPWRPFASIASWPARHRRDVFFVRLSMPRSVGTPVTISVGERRFRLTGSGSGAWSPEAATDRALVLALRGERSFSVAAISSNGGPFADTYSLSGAATAIDAAALGCLAARTSRASTPGPGPMVHPNSTMTMYVAALQ